MEILHVAFFREVETNTRSYLSKSTLFFSSECQLLKHIFIGKVASEGIQYDLIHFYSLGEADFQAFVKCFLLGDMTVRQTRHKRNLQTFTEQKTITTEEETNCLVKIQ